MLKPCYLNLHTLKDTIGGNGLDGVALRNILCKDTNITGSDPILVNDFQIPISAIDDKTNSLRTLNWVPEASKWNIGTSSSLISYPQWNQYRYTVPMYHNRKTISQDYQYVSNTNTLTNQYGLPPYKHDMEMIVKVATSSTDTHATLIKAIHDELMEFINETNQSSNKNLVFSFDNHSSVKDSELFALYADEDTVSSKFTKIKNIYLRPFGQMDMIGQNYSEPDTVIPPIKVSSSKLVNIDNPYGSTRKYLKNLSISVNICDK